MGITTNVSGFYEGYTVTQLEKLALWHVGQVLGTTVSFDRFPKWLIRAFLNERQNKFVSESHCLKKFALLIAKEGYDMYKLPSNCIDNGVIAVRYFEDADTYYDLELTDIETLDQEEPNWKTAENSDVPEKAFMGDSYGNVPMIGIYPRPDADGTDYALSPDTGVTVGDDLPGTVNNIVGTATGGGTTTLDDTNVDFTDMGLVEGMYARNVTDGSYAYIKTIAETELTFAAALTGGSANTFAAGDSYNILAGEYGVIVSWDQDERYIFSANIGLVNKITVPDGNFWVDYVPMPSPFSVDDAASDSNQGNDDQYPEIHKQYQIALVYGVVADLLATFHETSKEFQRAAYYEGKYNESLAKATMRKGARPFRRKQVNVYPRVRR